MKIKKMADRIINGCLLARLGLKLSYRVGSDPIEDIGRLLAKRQVDVIIDGGAYMGTFSQSIAQLFNRAKIHAFEPTPASHNKASDNLRKLPQVHVHRLAIGASNGKATLYENSSPLTNSLRQTSELSHRQFKDIVANRDKFDVDVTTLADFASQRNIDRIDILKLDLQGHEKDALIGMGDLIWSVKAALIEVQFVPLYEGAPLFSDIETTLRERGLMLYQIYELVRSPSDGRLLYGDALFIRSEILEPAS